MFDFLFCISQGKDFFFVNHVKNVTFVALLHFSTKEFVVFQTSGLTVSYVCNLCPAQTLEVYQTYVSVLVNFRL